MAVRSRRRTSALGRKQPFRPARKSQPSAQSCPIWGVNQDSNDTVRLGQLERLVCSILSGWFARSLRVSGIVFPLLIHKFLITIRKLVNCPP